MFEKGADAFHGGPADPAWVPRQPRPPPQVADIGTLRGTTGAVFQVTNCQMYGGYGGGPDRPRRGDRWGAHEQHWVQRRAGAHVPGDGRASMSQCLFSGISFRCISYHHDSMIIFPTVAVSKKYL